MVVEGTSYLAFRKWPLSWLLVLFLFCLFPLFLLFQFCFFPLSWPLYLGPWLCPTKKVPSVALAHPFEPETLANSNSIALIILMCHATIILPWYVKQHSPNNLMCHATIILPWYVKQHSLIIILMRNATIILPWYVKKLWCQVFFSDLVRPVQTVHSILRIVLARIIQKVNKNNGL